MNAGALVDGGDSKDRMMLGKISAGPLGNNEHSEMLQSIYDANRKQNPVKVAKDRVTFFFGCMVNFLTSCDPTRVSPEMAMEQTRPPTPESVSVVIFFFMAGMCGLGFFYGSISSGLTATVWEGPVDCRVIDLIIRDSSSGMEKLVVKLMDIDETSPLPETMDQDIFTDGFANVAFMCNVDVGTWYPDKEFGSGKKAAGPCCHSSFHTNYRRVNETFECYYTFDTSFCNDHTASFETDDDFRGMGANANVNVNGADQVIEDKFNGICCEDSVPSSYGGAMFMFVMACAIGAVTLWCVLFRLQSGVWHITCFFASPPPTSVTYTTQPKNVKKVPATMLIKGELVEVKSLDKFGGGKGTNKKKKGVSKQLPV